MPSPPLFTALILDLGDVLLTWNPDVMDCGISWPTLKRMRSSGTWQDYERGRLSKSHCYARLSREFSIPAEEISHAYKQALSSLQVNQDIAAFVKELKESSADLQVYALTNVSISEYNYACKLPFEWTAFDAVFPSYLVGERKPDRQIYDRLIAATGIDPRSAVFVDDKAENVAAARALGMHGIICDYPDKMATVLRDLFFGPVQRGIRFMQDHAGDFASVADDGRSFREYFAQLLILESTGDKSLVSLPECVTLWNFFEGLPLPDGIPDDLDTTSLAYTVLQHDPQSATRVMNEMLKYKTDQGLFLLYFDNARHRVDPFVNVNILTFFFRNGRGGDVPEALDYALDVLANRLYLGGSRYYLSPEMYLYLTSRLLDSDAALRSRVTPMLSERVKERVGIPVDPVDRAMRIIVCCKLGLDTEVDLQELLAAQHADGGWSIGWLYKYGRSGVRIGNRGVATALAIRAIQMATKPVPGFAAL